MEERDLIYWINEREWVRKHKEAGEPKPWSADPVFHTTYFCNVHREDDKVTKWIASRWRNMEGVKHEAAMVLARMFNLPDHLMYLDPRDPGCEENLVKSKNLRDSGHKLFSGAYLITTCGVRMDKVDYVYEVVRNVAKRTIFCDTLENTAKQLMQVNGLGTFMAAQVVADLKNTEGHPLQNATDWWSWCAVGPGSLRGIRWLDGYSSVTKGQFLRCIQSLHANLGSDIPKMHMQDFQNCLCEFDKYCRVKNGTGRSKRIYMGR